MCDECKKYERMIALAGVSGDKAFLEAVEADYEGHKSTHEKKKGPRILSKGR